MSDMNDYYSGKPNPLDDDLRRFHWKCPKEGCPFETYNVTERGLEQWKAAHILRHELETTRHLGPNPKAQRVHFDPLPPPPPRQKEPEEYEPLYLDHFQDEQFLKTRGIKYTEADATIIFRETL